MRRPSARADFNTTRFLKAARLIAASSGLMEVSYGAVAAVCRTQRSSIQRRFACVEDLRKATLDAWVHDFSSVWRTPSTAHGVAEAPSGVWGLLCRWFLAHARHQAPYWALGPLEQAASSQEREALRRVLVDELRAWWTSLHHELQEAGRGMEGGTPLAARVFSCTLGIGPASALLGESLAIESAARSCWSLLSATPGLAPVPVGAILELTGAATRMLRFRPAMQRVEEDTATAEAIRPRRASSPGAPAAGTGAPDPWDAVLADAVRDLARHRRRRPRELDG